LRLRVRILLALAILALAVGRPGFERSRDDERSIELHRSSLAKYFDPAKTNPLFVLVIGSDIREGDPKAGRADSLHVVAIDTRTGRGTIVGIPRDSYVPIPGTGTQKINASLYFGGPERVVATVQQLSGIRFHYWASVEFSHFRNLVDELGGVDVNVPYAMQDLPYSGANFGAGRRHMNGADALAFARNRHATPHGDFSRSENQGLLLLAGLSKFRVDASDPLKLGRYLLAFHRQVATNVPAGELIKLALVGRSVDPHRVRNLVLPGRGGSAGGASVVFLGPETRDIFRKIREDAVL
jgi:LCP family protein required for cell wall assembly